MDESIETLNYFYKRILQYREKVLHEVPDDAGTKLCIDREMLEAYFKCFFTTLKLVEDMMQKDHQYFFDN